MNRTVFLEKVEIWYKQRVLLLHSKGQAYSGLSDPFDNFKRNGEKLGLSKYQIWGVYAGKHLDSIFNAIKQNPEAPVDKSEGLKGRIEDAQNYLDLLRGMLEADEASNAKAQTESQQ